MKRILTIAAVSLASLSATAQGWVYSEEFKTDFQTSQDKGLDFVNCKTGVKYDAWNALYCTRKNGIGSVARVGSRVNTSGLYGKVARAVAARRPGSSSSSRSSTSRRVGNYNYNTSDAHINWVHERQAQIQAAKEEAAYKKKMEELQRKIADDNRAAEVTAQTNAALQVQTNARMARDRWHATQGAALAQQRARQAIVRHGSQFDEMKPQSTGSQQASRLRGANKPRRTMTYNPKPRNTARRILPQVIRKQRDPEADAINRQRGKTFAANVAKMELQSRPQPSRILIDMEKSRGWNSGKQFVLSEHAVSSLGKDWISVDLKPQYAPSTKRKMTREDYHNLIAIEIIEQRPLTPAEEKYYDNLIP